MSIWFEDVFGFTEKSINNNTTKLCFSLENNNTILNNKINNKKYYIGEYNNINLNEIKLPTPESFFDGIYKFFF